ncbi:MAG: hypothetical protein JXM79_07540 [Sedimentisphaerales bacterium]|nr:hypothetical protein [Sedimentisphaerales bacterium]
MQNPGKDTKHPVKDKEEEPSRAGVVRLERVKRKTSRDKFAKKAIGWAGKKAVAELHESEECFRTLFESTREGVVSIGTEGRVVSG